MASRAMPAHGALRLGVEVALGACTLWLLVQNAVIVMWIQSWRDSRESLVVASVVLKALRVVLAALWPWPAVGCLAILVMALIALRGVVWPGSGREVAHEG